MHIKEQLEVIRRGADELLVEQELIDKLKSGKPLSIAARSFAAAPIHPLPGTSASSSTTSRTRPIACVSGSASSSASDSAAPHLAACGLRFDLPQPLAQPVRSAPGSNPDKPPILR